VIALYTHHPEIKNDRLGCNCGSVPEKTVAIAFACFEAALIVFGILGVAQTPGFSEDWGYAFIACALLSFSGEIALVSSLMQTQQNELAQPMAV
jgi:hypothetical protein